MQIIENDDLLLALDIAQNTSIVLHSIIDKVTGRSYLSAPSPIFAFAVDNGTLRSSDTDVLVDTIFDDSPGHLQIFAHAIAENVSVELELDAVSMAPAILVRLLVENRNPGQIFLRTVMPTIRGLISEGMMVALPQEAGSVLPLTYAVLGMDFDIDISLPRAMNNMELVSIYDGNAGGGIFFADVDGDLDSGISPLQLNASAKEVVGFWIYNLDPRATVSLPRLAIGVHHSGDWHDAVDFYVAQHQKHWIFPQVPEWFREAGAIYACSAYGAGSIYLSYIANPFLADGAVWNTWKKHNGPWRDGVAGHPRQITPAGFVPQEGYITVCKQNDGQLDVFAVGFDGAVWATWESNNSPWRDARNAREPVRITPSGLATPGAPVFAASRPGNELDVFFVGIDGAIWVTWEKGDSQWQDGEGGREPRRITPQSLFPAAAHLCACQQSLGLFDVFAVNNDGAIVVTCNTGDRADGLWLDGTDGRKPLLVSPVGFAPPGAPLATAKQSADQLDVFVVGMDGAVSVTWERGNGAWRDGQDGRAPARITPPDFCPPGSHLAVAQQSEDQLDVFVVGNDGAVYVTWEQGDSSWRDGGPGGLPVAITPPKTAAPGAPLQAVMEAQNRWNIFVINSDGAITLTWEDSNGPWTDGIDGRPGPVEVSPPAMFPLSGSVAGIERNSNQMDAFGIGKGALRSFLDLPVLLSQALALGTNVLYLTDYWEGTEAVQANDASDPPYDNKGDYVPRADLGGAEAFTSGIKALHDAGGRIVLYVEPFIIYQYSDVANEHRDWAATDYAGNLLPDYGPDFLKMAAPYPPWQGHIVDVVSRLVRDYGADGIYLDSYGWQMNRPMKVDGNTYSALAHAQGVLELVDEIRTAIQSFKPDAVVFGETTAGPIAFHWHGGLSADFANSSGFTTRQANGGRLQASPVRYGMPQLNIFSNGTSLEELHQIFAAGHNLALCNYFPGSFMFEFAEHIRTLVQIRKDYKDVLIYGAQTYQPRCTNPNVAAYYFRGSQHRMITIANLSTVDQTTDVELEELDSQWTWVDLLTGEISYPQSTKLLQLVLRVGTGSIKVLRRSLRLNSLRIDVRKRLSASRERD